MATSFMYLCGVHPNHRHAASGRGARAGIQCLQGGGQVCRGQRKMVEEGAEGHLRGEAGRCPFSRWSGTPDSGMSSPRYRLAYLFLH
jgi:hypothetical protein